MPELPDITVYIRAMNERILGQPLKAVRVGSPFVVRTVAPPISSAIDKTVLEIRRLGKQIVFCMGEPGGSLELFVVIHLMIAGRFLWRKPKSGLPGKLGLAAFDFEDGTLVFTEAGTKKRASIHCVGSELALQDFDRGGLDVMNCSLEEFSAALTRENHTIKRSLTDPRTLSGIGNAYSDEVLHRAHISPFKQTSQFSQDDFQNLLLSIRSVMSEWIKLLDAERKGGFPEKVTAFRPEMAVHGKYGQPCPVCEDLVQRISYADNEANYCVTCQTGGKLLADRGLSRLLKSDWPKTLAELEVRRSGTR